MLWHAVTPQEVAGFITERDGHPSYPDRIFLTNGASEGDNRSCPYLLPYIISSRWFDISLISKAVHLLRGLVKVTYDCPLVSCR